MPHLPTVGSTWLYTAFEKAAIFKVVEVNKDTGCIYLLAEEPTDHEKVVSALNHTVKNKRGEPIEVPVFAWLAKENRWAVNAEWEVWKGMAQVFPVKDRMTELVRLTEEYGGYEKEFGVKG